jgi:PhzF family phenazine biosynthesis protein
LDAGNVLAVFTDADGLEGQIMQPLAREMNLPGSTFVLRPTVTGADARIRTFTPMMESPFAGHPTLGTAFVLGASMPGDLIRLEWSRAWCLFGCRAKNHKLRLPQDRRELEASVREGEASPAKGDRIPRLPRGLVRAAGGAISTRHRARLAIGGICFGSTAGRSMPTAGRRAW